MKQLPKLTLLALAISALAACGSGSSGSGSADNDSNGISDSTEPSDTTDSSGDTDTPSTNDVTISGRAADGYLVNARVCLDLNSNLICDAGEPSATTGAGGTYNLTATAEQKSQFSVVVEVVKDQTTDEDTGSVVSASYTLTAPAGQAFVSPMTTLVSGTMRANAALTVEQAAERVRSSMSLPVNSDLLADFIADNNSEVHAAAQNFAQVLGSALESAQALAGDNGITDDDFSSVFNALVQRMQEQAQAIADAGSSELANIELIGDGEKLTDLVDDGDVKSESAEAAVLNEGLTTYWVASDYAPSPRYDMHSASIQKVEDKLAIGSTTTSVTGDEYNNYSSIVWTDSGWAVEATDYTECDIDSSGSDLIISCGTSWVEKFGFSKVALKGRSVSNYLTRASEDWLEAYEMPSLASVTAVFDDSAYEYSLVTTVMKERLALWDCELEEGVALVDHYCDADSVADSFSGMTARDINFDMEYLADNGDGGSGYVYLGGNPATDSTGPIFLKVDNSENPEDTSLDTQISTWEKVTLADNGPTIIKLTRFGSDLDLPEFNALVMYEGKVQHAEYYPVGAVSVNGFYLNKAASDQLKETVGTLFPIVPTSE